jgi:hypothetical protein
VVGLQHASSREIQYPYRAPRRTKASGDGFQRPLRSRFQPRPKRGVASGIATVQCSCCHVRDLAVGEAERFRPVRMTAPFVRHESTRTHEEETPCSSRLHVPLKSAVAALVALGLAGCATRHTKEVISTKEAPAFASPSASTSTMPQHIRSPELLPQVTAPNGVVNANQGLQWTRGSVARCGVMIQSEVGGSSAPTLKPESLDTVRKSCGVMLKQTDLFPPVVPAEGGCRRGLRATGGTPSRTPAPKCRVFCLPAASVTPAPPRGRDQAPSSLVRR